MEPELVDARLGTAIEKCLMAVGAVPPSLGAALRSENAIGVMVIVW